MLLLSIIIIKLFLKIYQWRESMIITEFLDRKRFKNRIARCRTWNKEWGQDDNDIRTKKHCDVFKNGFSSSSSLIQFLFRCLWKWHQSKTSNVKKCSSFFFSTFFIFFIFQIPFRNRIKRRKKIKLNRNLLLLSHPFFTLDIRSQQRE